MAIIIIFLKIFWWSTYFSIMSLAHVLILISVRKLIKIKTIIYILYIVLSFKKIIFFAVLNTEHDIVNSFRTTSMYSFLKLPLFLTIALIMNLSWPPPCLGNPFLLESFSTPVASYRTSLKCVSVNLASSFPQVVFHLPPFLFPIGPLWVLIVR